MARGDVEILQPNPAVALLSSVLGCGGGGAAPVVSEDDFVVWENFKKYLRGYRLIRPAFQAAVAVFFLESPVEEQVAAAWERSPSAGFVRHNLAAALVMAAAGEAIPEIRAAGCAPLPAPDEDLRRHLRRLGLILSESGSLNRQYAVMTFAPSIGGCAVCHLRAHCPKCTVRGGEAPGGEETKADGA